MDGSSVAKVGGGQVALRKESVDRNFSRHNPYPPVSRRSPQGERG